METIGNRRLIMLLNVITIALLAVTLYLQLERHRHLIAIHDALSEMLADVRKTCTVRVPTHGR